MSTARNGAIKRAAKTATKSTAHVGQAIDQVSDRLQQFADHAIAGAESNLSAAQEATSHYVEQGREAMGSVGDLVRAYVKSQPVKSLAIAAGAGLVLSMFLRRR